MQTACQANEPSDDTFKSGDILKASAAFHFSQLLSARPGSEKAGQPGQAAQASEVVNRRRRTKRHAVLLIATQLNELQEEDPDKIVVVRKINRLVSDSANLLKKHFGRFGVVEEVRLSNAHNKEPGVSFNVRLRPSGIAFVVFESLAVVSQVLAEGDKQMIFGVEVCVRRFERRRCDTCTSEECMKPDGEEEMMSVTTGSTRCSTASFCDQDEPEEERV